MKRIFIAIKVEPAETLLKMISEIKSGLNKDIIKWTHTDNIHITIAFLGDTEDSLIKNIKTMLKNKSEGSGKFILTLKGYGVFRSLNDPRIIWAGIESTKELIDLNDSIVRGLKELNIKIEDRPFNPHLTLGRIKKINDNEALRLLIEKYQNSEIQIVPVNEIILFESFLLQSGPVYKPLAKFSLN
jgi:2'-5' RNA ligase